MDYANIEISGPNLDGQNTLTALNIAISNPLNIYVITKCGLQRMLIR